MKYGMNLLLWTDAVGQQHYPLLEKIKSWGYDGVELPMFSPEADQFRKIGERIKDIGLECTAVTVMPEEANPIDPDAQVRAAAVEHLKRAIDASQALGAKLLCGPFCSPVGKLVGRGRTDEEWRWAVDAFKQVAPYAEKAGITLGVEFLNRFETYFINCVADTARLVDEVGSRHFGMMYDTFHANIEEKRVCDAIRSAGRRIVHVHISENDRATPGEGHVQWDETFAALKQIGYDGWFMVEAFGQALPSLAAATCIWRRMFESEERLATAALQFMRSQWEAT